MSAKAKQEALQQMITDIIVESVKAVESTGHTFTKKELKNYVNRITDKIQPIAVCL